LISRAVGNIDGYAHFFERPPARKARLGKFDITTERVIDSRSPSNSSGSRADGIDFACENELLDLFFHLIVQLVAVVPEKFDSVIFVRIMRGGEDDAGVGAKRPRDVRDARRRQRPDDENIDPERGDSRDERVLEHVTGKTGVFAKHYFGTRALWVLAWIELSENVRGGAAQFQRCLGRDRFDIGDPADTVRSEDFPMLGHGLTETREEQFVKGKLSPKIDVRARKEDRHLACLAGGLPKFLLRVTPSRTLNVPCSLVSQWLPPTFWPDSFR